MDILHNQCQMVVPKCIRTPAGYNTVLNGRPCCDETGSFAHRRDAPQFLRNYAAPKGHRFRLSLDRDGQLVFLCAPWRGCMALRGYGGNWESPAQKHGAVCADRLARKRTARAFASDIFVGTINPAPVMRESPLRQSAD